MNILFVTSEAYPFMKSGGLGDVAYSLPKALKELGINIRVIMPKYECIANNFKTKMLQVNSFTVPVGWRNQYCGLQYLNYDGIPFYFIDNEYYFKRPNSYGFFDDGERFSYFSRAVLESIPYMDDFVPDVIHCNDWHTAMVPLLLKAHYKDNSIFEKIKTIFTIHNLKYQGVFPKEILGDLLNLSYDYYSEDKLKFYDGISFMKGGIIYSDKVTTVSETYSKEIREAFYGEGLHGLLNYNSNKLSGIVNGIDYDLFNPSEDTKLYKSFDENNLDKKLENKLKLQAALNLPVNKDIPLIGIVSRLVKQKGFDLMACVMEELLRLDLQIVVLGTGDEDLEDLFEYYSSIYPSKLSSNIAFSDSLARKIYGASDMFLMPSLFEPCGIGQLIALHYGSIPIVRKTGGLKDTVTYFNSSTLKGNGFTFQNYNAHEMLFTIKDALELYKDKVLWNTLVKNAMTSINTWRASAESYISLYKELCPNTQLSFEDIEPKNIDCISQNSVSCDDVSEKLSLEENKITPKEVCKTKLCPDFNKVSDKEKEAAFDKNLL